jgi:hypothetical protein
MTDLIAVLDTDVLVPIVACDFLLTAFDHGLYEPAVPTMVLDEVERTLHVDFPHLSREAIHHRVGSIRRVLADHLLDVDAVDVPGGINAKDRHVVGAAIIGEANLVVSNDRRLRSEIEASSIAARPLSLDVFATTLEARDAERVSAVVDTLVAKRRKVPTTREAMLTALRGHMPSLGIR